MVVPSRAHFSARRVGGPAARGARDRRRGRAPRGDPRRGRQDPERDRVQRSAPVLECRRSGYRADGAAGRAGARDLHHPAEPHGPGGRPVHAQHRRARRRRHAAPGRVRIDQRRSASGVDAVAGRSVPLHHRTGGRRRAGGGRARGRAAHADRARPGAFRDQRRPAERGGPDPVRRGVARLSGRPRGRRALQRGRVRRERTGQAEAGRNHQLPARGQPRRRCRAAAGPEDRVYRAPRSDRPVRAAADHDRARQGPARPGDGAVYRSHRHHRGANRRSGQRPRGPGRRHAGAVCERPPVLSRPVP